MIVIKAVAATRISLRAERLTYLVGFVFLMAFLIWITYFDIARAGAVTGDPWRARRSSSRPTPDLAASRAGRR